MWQAPLGGAEGVQGQGLVNTCGRRRLGSFFLVAGLTGCEGTLTCRSCGRIVNTVLSAADVSFATFCLMCRTYLPNRIHKASGASRR